jgi:hypothetical protein
MEDNITAKKITAGKNKTEDLSAIRMPPSLKPAEVSHER